jgi:hypothetical protein
MKQQLLNKQSGFYTGQCVNVMRKDTNEIYNGTVAFTSMEPINRASPKGPITDYIYVQFDGLVGREAYSKWLLQGSPIFCSIVNLRKKCVVREIEYDEHKIIKMLRVVEDDGGNMINPIEYYIKVGDIHSMLIWRDGYEITV